MAISIDVEVHLILSSSILQMKISSPSLALSWAALVQALLMRAASLSSLSPRVLITSGCCFSSNIAFFQSILGWKAANQGYPKTNLSSPMWVTRKRISSFLGPTCTCRSTYSLIDPDLLWVPSIFQMYWGFFRGNFPIFILLRSFSLMKLSVAPESTRTSRSAFVCLKCKIVGIFNDLYLHENTFLSPKVRAMAAWVAPAKNPAPWELPFSVSPHEIKLLI